MSKSKLWIILFSIGLSLFVSCEKNPGETVENSVEPETVAVEQSQVPLTSNSVISFLSGEVLLKHHGQEEWIWADIGQPLVQGDSIQTGPDGYCEIQLGGISIIRVVENTNFSLATLYEQEDRRDIELDLEQGTIACKVNKLLNSDSFEVEIPTAACGIRGTQFLVSFTPGEETLLAVQEGSVSFLPKASAEAEPIQEDILLVEPGQEISLSQEDYQEVTSLLQESEESTEIVDQVVSILREEVQELAPENEEVMKGLEEEEILSIADEAEEEAPQMVQLSLFAEPATASLLVNGQPLIGSFQAVVPMGYEIALQAEAPGYYPLEELYTVDQQDQQSFEVRLERRPVQNYSIQTQGNVQINLNSEVLGRGNAEVPVMEGESALLTLSAAGFNSQRVLLEFESEEDRSLTINLKRTLERSFTASTSAVAGVGTMGNQLILSDQDGALTAFTMNGDKLWLKATANYPNPNSIPYIHSNRIYFSGAKTLDIISINGTNLSSHQSRSLDKDELQFFGSSMFIHQGSLVYPTSTGFSFLNAQDGSVESMVAMEGGNRMTPSLYQGKIYAVSQTGVVMRFSADGTLEDQLQSGLDSPIAQSIVFHNGAGYFADKNGKVASFNPSTMGLNWTADLPGADTSVSHNLMPQGSMVYVYSTGRVFSMDRNGRNARQRVQGLSSASLVQDHFLYGGTENGQFIVEDLLNNQRLSTTALNQDEQVTSQIFSTGNQIIAGTNQGRILVFNTQDSSIRLTN